MATLSLSAPRWWPRGLGAVAAPWSALPRHARARRVLTWSLGVLWLLDAALQYQPFMFSRAFPDQVIRPAGAGSPTWVAAPLNWAAQLMAGHIIVFNALFATVQLGIAVGLFLRSTLRLALTASIVWAVLVWWLGEGFGGVLAGPVSPLMGLPGAVILYALTALLVWPRPGPEPRAPVVGSVADTGLLHPAAARAVWLLLWTSFAFEAVRPANRAPAALHDMIAGMASGEPRWLATINTGVAQALAHHGDAYSIGLAVVCLLIGVGVLVPATTRPAVVVAVLLALLIWIVGEDLGEIATGTGTDPNTGLPLALLALCYWPWTTARPAGTPTAERREPTARDPAA